MKPLNAKSLLKILERHGFVLSRQRGSHFIYHNQITGISVPIPLHGKNKPIPLGTFLAIVRQSKIPRKKFEQ